MTFYLAAKYRFRPALLQLAALLSLNHHKVVGRWLTGRHQESSPAAHQQWAQEDLDDIDMAECLVVVQLPNVNPEPSSGRNIEFGFALAHGKRVILIGQQTSVFHFLPRVEHYDNIADFLNVFAPGVTWE